MNNSLLKYLIRIRPIELQDAIKRILGLDRVELRFKNLQFQIDPLSNFGRRLLLENNYEPEFESSFRNLIKEGDTVMDLGTNEGYFSVMAASIVGNTGVVFSIEPQERLWSVIMKNMLINDFFNYRLIPCAVGEKEEQAEIILTPSVNTGSSSLIKDDRKRNWKRQMVRVRPLDDLMVQFNIDHIDLLKIDIEGYEYNALKSALVSLRAKKIKSVIVEMHPLLLSRMGQSVAEIIRFMNELGYRYRDHSDFGVFTIA